MFSSVKKNLEKQFDRSVDFVKSQLIDQPRSPIRPVSSDGTYVYYTIREAPADISDFNSKVDDSEESVFLVNTSFPTVSDVMHAFPIKHGNFLFRFKFEDDVFGFVWRHVVSGDMAVPSWRGNVYMEVLHCHSDVRMTTKSVDTSTTLSVPVVLNRADLVRERQARESAQVQAARDFAAQNISNENQRRQEKFEIQNILGSELDKWSLIEQGKFKDIRSLLSTMSFVLWQGSGWVDVPIGELMLNDAVVKKTYRRAIILCHPDRHQQASAEQQFRADRIFNAINEAWKGFDK